MGNGPIRSDREHAGYAVRRNLPSYSMAALTGTMAAGIAADSEWYHARWADADGAVCLIDSVMLSGLGAIVGFTPGRFAIGLYIARAWTVAGTGGTALTMTGGRLRTGYPDPASMAIRVATTAALGVGTKTLDANPISVIDFEVTADANIPWLGQVQLFSARADRKAPIVLANEEGLVARVVAPAVGTWHASMSLDWTRSMKAA